MTQNVIILDSPRAGRGGSSLFFIGASGLAGGPESCMYVRLYGSTVARTQSRDFFLQLPTYPYVNASSRLAGASTAQEVYCWKPGTGIFGMSYCGGIHGGRGGRICKAIPGVWEGFWWLMCDDHLLGRMGRDMAVGWGCACPVTLALYFLTPSFMAEHSLTTLHTYQQR